MGLAAQGLERVTGCFRWQMITAKTASCIDVAAEIRPSTVVKVTPEPPLVDLTGFDSRRGDRALNVDSMHVDKFHFIEPRPGALQSS